MKKSGSTQGQPASGLIGKRIAELGDWRGETDAGAFKALIRTAVALNGKS